ncbi:MAG TPA: UTP--glucose-1-phosphate uridylyltransferase GalU [Geminicoccaceae bacterium]|nr:UTP--glucose-1-phosphate uridylyltransferase GalU [Geminicoccaceae bacterium]
MIRKAVFPVAGLGTRMLPATKAVPKEMLPVVDRPLIQYAFEEARAAGIEQFVFVTGRGKSVIEDHFDRSYELDDSLGRKGKTTELEAVSSWLPAPGELAYTRQPDALGLGHAVWCARHLVGDEPFAVILVDDLITGRTPCLQQMVEAFAETRGNLVAVEEVPHDQTDRYGVLDPISDDGRLVEIKGLVEKPDPAEAPSRLAVIGRYILLPEVFEHLSRQERGAGGEIQLTDAMAKMIGGAPFHGLRFAGRRFDCGGKLGYLEALIACALEREDLRDGMRRILERYLEHDR